MNTKKFLQIAPLLTSILLLLPTMSAALAQTNNKSPNNTIDVPVYKKIQPLIKENTFLVIYINADKIDLDSFINKSTTYVKQFSQTLKQKLQEQPKTKSPEPEITPESEPTTPTDPNAAPATTPTPIPPNASPDTEQKSETISEPNNTSNTKTKSESDITEQSDESLEKSLYLFFDNISENTRQTIGSTLKDLRDNGIKELYILSTMEILQQCQAIIAVQGKIKLNPKLKTKFQSNGIHLLSDSLNGFTVFAYDPNSVQLSPNPTNNTIIDPNNPQPENLDDSDINTPSDNTLITTQDNPANPNPNPNPNRLSPDGNQTNTPSNAVIDTINKYDNVVKIFKNLKTAKRSEIQSGLHIHRNAPIRIVFAPSSGLKSLASMAPMFIAGNPALKSKSTQDIIKTGLQIFSKLQSVSIGFIPENIRLNFAIEFMKEEDAQSAYTLIKKIFNDIKSALNENFKEEQENTPPEQAAHITNLVNKLLDTFMPHLRKHRIVYSVTEKVISETNNIFAEIFAITFSKIKLESENIVMLNNVKVTILALQNYQVVHKNLPPLYTVDAAGKPLHSWRVLILPFLDQKNLYDKIKLDEAWDSEYNKQFHSAIVNVYSNKGIGTNNKTNETCRLAAIIDSPMKAGKSVDITEISDGTSNTAAIVELRKPFCWMNPNTDITIEEFSKPLDNKDTFIGGTQEDNVIIGFWDGNVKKIPLTTSPETLKAIATPRGGENIALP
ncbi:MAG: DUF1559 domain-containing protein [Planctomycetaceae bacterium]|jgi:hypothetical protein|nr:DUF1559 domain-containing protein [Planctomycetaceae bacterium]